MADLIPCIECGKPLDHTEPWSCCTACRPPASQPVTRTTAPVGGFYAEQAMKAAAEHWNRTSAVAGSLREIEREMREDLAKQRAQVHAALRAEHAAKAALVEAAVRPPMSFVTGQITFGSNEGPVFRGDAAPAGMWNHTSAVAEAQRQAVRDEERAAARKEYEITKALRAEREASLRAEVLAQLSARGWPEPAEVEDQGDLGMQWEGRGDRPGKVWLSNTCQLIEYTRDEETGEIGIGVADLARIVEATDRLRWVIGLDDGPSDGEIYAAASIPAAEWRDLNRGLSAAPGVPCSACGVQPAEPGARFCTPCRERLQINLALAVIGERPMTAAEVIASRHLDLAAQRETCEHDWVDDPEVARAMRCAWAQSCTRCPSVRGAVLRLALESPLETAINRAGTADKARQDLFDHVVRPLGRAADEAVGLRPLPEKPTPPEPPPFVPNKFGDHGDD